MERASAHETALLSQLGCDKHSRSGTSCAVLAAFTQTLASVGSSDEQTLLSTGAGESHLATETPTSGSTSGSLPTSGAEAGSAATAAPRDAVTSKEEAALDERARYGMSVAARWLDAF